jgi:hypothetical protein
MRKRRLGIRKGMQETRRGNRLYVAISFVTQTKWYYLPVRLALSAVKNST